MRLYLSSYQLGDHADAFAGLVRGHRRGWLVMNAVDGLDDSRREAGKAQETRQLARIGLEVHDFDLRDYTPATIAQAFGVPDFVWVRGGNVFTLRMAMAVSGLDSLLTRGLADDAFVYAGFSAGACVLAPSLSGLELCDPVQVCATTYGSVRYDGLDVLDRPVVPHLDSPGHPETDVLGAVAQLYTARGQPYWGLRDGEALVLDGRIEDLARAR